MRTRLIVFWFEQWLAEASLPHVARLPPNGDCISIPLDDDVAGLGARLSAVLRAIGSLAWIASVVLPSGTSACPACGFRAKPITCLGPTARVNRHLVSRQDLGDWIRLVILGLVIVAVPGVAAGLVVAVVLLARML